MTSGDRSGMVTNGTISGDSSCSGRAGASAPRARASTSGWARGFALRLVLIIWTYPESRPSPPSKSVPMASQFVKLVLCCHFPQRPRPVELGFESVYYGVSAWFGVTTCFYHMDISGK